jgi:ssDNA-binding Zn-finger/Zn-ribbon topoisomerase 1
MRNRLDLGGAEIIPEASVHGANMAEKPVVTCPNCEKKFKAKADVRGKKILCPFCDESFVVADVAIQDKAAPAALALADDDDGTIPLAIDPGTVPLAGKKAKAARVEEEEPVDNDDPYGVTHLDSDPRCPNCTEKMVPKNAVVCLACGYNTLTREWGKTEKTMGVSFGRQFVYLVPGFFALGGLFLYLCLQVGFASPWPSLVAGVNWLEWSDYEGLRMWTTTAGFGLVWYLGHFCYRRFIVKPLPDEVKME